MTQTFKALGIDRMSAAERIALALEIWASLDADRPVGSLSDEQRAELLRRDRELDENPGLALTWEQMRASLDAEAPE